MRRFGRALVVLVVLLGLLYVGDWAVLRVRISHGTAYRVVTVNQFLATPLKGNKVEYDLMGTAPETCSRSIFPQAEIRRVGGLRGTRRSGSRGAARARSG